jgi:uncharacterized protein (TIGR04255 family)
MPPTPADPEPAATRLLPEPDTRLLARPPLETVVFDVRFLTQAAGLPPEAGLRLREFVEASGWPVERLEQIQQHAMQVQFGPDQTPNPVVSAQGVGWRLIPPDGSWTATVVPGQAALQSTKYEKWETEETGFRSLVAAVLEATEEVAVPSLYQRVGLRYIDRFVEDSARRPSDWVGRIDSAVLGPLLQGGFGPLVIGAQQQLELGLGASRRAVLRHGPFPDGAVHGAISYLLDIDVSDTSSSAFHVKAVLATADELNLDALALFQACICPDYLSELRGTR